MITLIVARDCNGAIGKDNTIPWYAPEDLAFFKRETMGGAVIMGRNTWESLPFRPLKNRQNIVVSTRGAADAEHVFPDLEGALEFARAEGHSRIYGMGGARIYEALLPMADRLLVTEVALEVDEPDTFFPAFSDRDWQLNGTSLLRDADPRCELHEYLRIRG